MSSVGLEPVGLDVELEALARSRRAVRDKLDRFSRLSGGAADALSQDYVDAVVADTIDALQRDLVVFGRIDDESTWRIGLYGIDEGGDQLVVDWRAPFARAFYQARHDDPVGLRRRVSYVGCIDDLLIEDLVTGAVDGTSPLLAELTRERGERMRAAVATLQSEQDALVRLAPTERLVLRGGPGTGKTVVALHRAAWLVYNDRRITADRLLVIGPSDRFLRHVETVLPTLGERKIRQTTFAQLLGAAAPAGAHPGWPALLDRFERSLLTPGPVRAGGRTIPADEVVDLLDRMAQGSLSWRDRRRALSERLAARCGVSRRDVSTAVSAIMPACSARQALQRLMRPATLRLLGADAEHVEACRTGGVDGALADEVRARFEGVSTRYSHVIVDEAQDLTPLQLRAVRRRARGLTFVGDDAQRSHDGAMGLTAVAAAVGVEPAVMATAYRMSAEIADWLNDHAAVHGIDAVRLVGIRPTGRPVRRRAGGGHAAVGAAGGAPDAADGAAVGAALADLRARWGNVAAITAADVWSHQGVEYDAVVVDASQMTPRQVYLAASRAAHELVVVGSGAPRS